jgi:hypothetical protein
MDLEESPNPVLPMGEIEHPQQDKLKPKIILLAFKSSTLG